MKYLALGLIFALSSGMVSAKEGRPIKLSLGLMTESFSIDTQASNSTNKAKASFFSGQMIPAIGFFVHPKILLGAQYTQSFMGEFSVSGVGAFARYYFMGESPRRITLEDLEVELASNYSLYAGATYKNLSIGSGDFDVRFSAIEVSAGVEKYFSHEYFLFGAAQISKLSSSGNRTGLSMGLTGGIGYHY